jgi:chorismate mutase
VTIARAGWQIHGRVRRYTSPDEHAFYPDALPALVLPPLTYPKVRPEAYVTV